jgi:integrase
MHCDGGGLYLQVTVGVEGKERRRSWLFRFATTAVERAGNPALGRERQMGLGSYPDTKLKEARDKAADARKQRERGMDPIRAREAEKSALALAGAKAMTFNECAAAYIQTHRAGWRNRKHAGQWEATLATYAHPVIGGMSVHAIDTTLVMKVLEPVWTAKPETASRLRGRLERVLDWAKARGYREGENPARWRGHLDKLLPALTKVRKVEHHAALPYRELPGFLAKLRQQEGVAARALEFSILTAARTGEILGATWDELDLAARLWTVPGARMKAGKEHRIPLSDAALDVLAALPRENGKPFVFVGARPGKALSRTAMLTQLERMGRSDLTVHGFRSSFRDWVSERTNFPSELAEMALAHVVAGKVEAAYRRGDMFDKRRGLMSAWAQFCSEDATDAKVIPIAATLQLT